MLHTFSGRGTFYESTKRHLFELRTVAPFFTRGNSLRTVLAHLPEAIFDNFGRWARRYLSWKAKQWKVRKDDAQRVYPGGKRGNGAQIENMRFWGLIKGSPACNCIYVSRGEFYAGCNSEVDNPQNHLKINRVWRISCPICFSKKSTCIICFATDRGMGSFLNSRWVLDFEIGSGTKCSSWCIYLQAGEPFVSPQNDICSNRAQFLPLSPGKTRCATSLHIFHNQLLTTLDSFFHFSIKLSKVVDLKLHLINKDDGGGGTLWIWNASDPSKPKFHFFGWE